MESGGAFHLKAGEWTDDPLDQMQRYVRWMRDGHLSSIGRCFDIGNTTSAALSKFERTGRPYGWREFRNYPSSDRVCRRVPLSGRCYGRRAAGRDERTAYGELVSSRE
jgi:hypothetical protein